LRYYAGTEVFLENGGEDDILACGDPKNFHFGRELVESIGCPGFLGLLF
jgi:hypothetical protein